ncbi:Ribonuclease H protein [Quillaja saponaria]|uniref:Ribonuclease H protein n=1 Tax=Quillaja saponaria TaxID=32244 RepID=A0AAD7KYS5_QUISA|nr:Ribonuclease H protein [Quillaja saponaria]
MFYEEYGYNDVPKNLGFARGLWWLWNWRCRQIFEEDFVSPREPDNVILQTAQEAYRVFMDLKNPVIRKVIKWISWSKPETGYIKVNFDGVVLTSQLRAGCGGVFRNKNGDWLLGFHMNLGCCSSKVAELEGIRAGLLIARNNE